MDNQKYNSVPEMVAAAIFRTQKYLKSMKKVLRLMKRNRPVEEVRAALNEALGIVGGEINMDNINSMLREKILEYLYDINARCDYKLEEVAYDIVDIVNEVM